MSGSIYLLRHAEAGWGGQEQGDKARQLSDLGHESADKIGFWFLKEGLKLDYVICSTAVRAKETLDGFLASSGLTPEVEYIDDLYLAAPETIISALQEKSIDHENLMVVGHNPGMHQVAFEFALKDLQNSDLDLTTSYPPAGLTGFKRTGNEKPFDVDHLSLSFFMVPAKL